MNFELKPKNSFMAFKRECNDLTVEGGDGQLARTERKPYQ
jgi:hypothetical protein